MKDEESTIPVLDIQEMIIQISNELKINDNGLGFSIVNASEFATISTMAAYDRKNDIILINQNHLFSEDLICFAIAHELRHKWQDLNKSNIFDDYKPSSKINLQDYNNQMCEKDANKFAFKFMDKYYPGWCERIEKITGINIKKQVGYSID